VANDFALGMYQNRERKERWIIVGVLAGVVFVFTFFLGVMPSVRDYRAALRMYATDPVNATVTAFREDEYDWYAKVEFQAQGQTIRASLIDYPPTLAVGQTVLVNYDPAKPTTATMSVGDYEASAKDGIWFGIALMFILPGIAVVAMWRYAQYGENPIDKYTSTYSD
jgi:hypothetical protein